MPACLHITGTKICCLSNEIGKKKDIFTSVSTVLNTPRDIVETGQADAVYQLVFYRIRKNYLSMSFYNETVNCKYCYFGNG